MTTIVSTVNNTIASTQIVAANHSRWRLRIVVNGSIMVQPLMSLGAAEGVDLSHPF